MSVDILELIPPYYAANAIAGADSDPAVFKPVVLHNQSHINQRTGIIKAGVITNPVPEG
jgi:hypothetical protein